MKNGVDFLKLGERRGVSTHKLTRDSTVSTTGRWSKVTCVAVWVAGIFMMAMLIAWAAGYWPPRVTITHEGPWHSVDSVKSALNTFYLDNERFPTKAEGLEALVARPSGSEATWHGPYLEAVPQDTWGSAFVYQGPDPLHPDRYILRSMGPDKIDGTVDDMDFP